MKQLTLILFAALSSYALDLKLKDGTVVSGNPICENKSTIVLKSGTETISLFKKSIAFADTVSLEGKREFMVGEAAILKEKNDIQIFNHTPDSCTVRLRRSPEGTRFLEKSCGPGETITFAVTDGSFFETVRYWRSEGEYYTVGQPFTLETKPSTFQQHQIELKGFLGDKIPNLKGPKIAYERE